VHDTAGTSWPGFTKSQSLDGAILLLPAKATKATRGLPAGSTYPWARLDDLVIIFFFMHFSTIAGE